MRILAIPACLAVALSVLVCLGLHTEPKSFPPGSRQPSVRKTVRLPEGLPTPVECFYKIYDDSVPLMKVDKHFLDGTSRPELPFLRERGTQSRPGRQPGSVG